MDKLKCMRTFMLTIEEGSLVKAAQQLYITKAAVSKQIIELENYLNVQLLHRNARDLRPTVAGQLFYESLHKVFSAVTEAEATVAEVHLKPMGTLRVTSHRYFGEKYIVKNLKEFTKLYPDLKIDLELSDRFPDIEKEKIDVLCGVGHEGPQHLVRKRITSAYHILCAAPKYLTKLGTPKKPAHLKNHRFITHSFRNPDNIISFANNETVTLDYHIRLNDAQAMLQCALQGLGIIKIYNYFVEEFIESGKLVEILKDYREPKKPLYVFYQQNKFVLSKIRVFIDFLNAKVNPETNELINVSYTN